MILKQKTKVLKDKPLSVSFCPLGQVFLWAVWLSCQQNDEKHRVQQCNMSFKMKITQTKIITLPFLFQLHEIHYDTVLKKRSLFFNYITDMTSVLAHMLPYCGKQIPHYSLCPFHQYFCSFFPDISLQFNDSHGLTDVHFALEVSPQEVVTSGQIRKMNFPNPRDYIHPASYSAAVPSCQNTKFGGQSYAVITLGQGS